MIAAGQRVAVASAGSVTKLGVLGAADGWGAQGTATLNYTDGSQQSITLGFTDWTRAGGQIPVQYGNTIAAQMPYSNKGSGERENVPTYVFAATFQLQAGKTVESGAADACTSMRSALADVRTYMEKMRLINERETDHGRSPSKVTVTRRRTAASERKLPAAIRACTQ